MGVGGNFWDLLKPYAQNEGFDFLRNKKVAVDLSFWIVQHETALKNKARNPHLRLTFFRTINLFSKLGAFPVFVIDGVPSPLKARARIERFFRFSGIDLSGLPMAEDGVSVERNGAFTKCVRECVELLEILGMPILKASSEAEALCAQLNSEGHVDACITADSDAFLFGAKCVIKCLRPTSKEPFECYHMSDIEAGLGLKRTHLIAISLLVGNDHDLGGVSGVGIDTALQFVQMFPEDEILSRLQKVGNGDIPSSQISTESFVDRDIRGPDGSSPKTKSPHCSYCGHPGTKRAHLKLACEYCTVNCNENCMQKPVGFKCECSSCVMDRKSKEQKKQKNWLINVCSKIAMEQNFPNDEIVDMYLRHNHGNIKHESISLLWEKPKIDTLIDFLGYHQQWDPSYIRQRLLPMLSTIFLREMASNPTEGLLLHEQYEFHSIQRVKIRYGHPCYLVNWKKIAPVGNANYTIRTEECDIQQEGILEVSESIDLLDDPDVPEIRVDDGCWFLLTDENMELVQAAFPEEVNRFLQEKEKKESKLRKRKSVVKSEGDQKKSETPKSSGVQLSITEFYRSKKVSVSAKQEEEPVNNYENQAKGSSTERRNMSSPNLSKSVRRRLLFD
ncbi:XPG/Rad2 endonuclease [Macleaya cordata]|uniref:Flap endonuclease GEN-like 1 n=1 Tax=Macleaya cordata TaxID=56857 RepID=A0A200R0E5_MACCD|nr:XPG/Rad2 endonuclease [Macleaya cordata]